MPRSPAPAAPLRRALSLVALFAAACGGNDAGTFVKYNTPPSVVIKAPSNDDAFEAGALIEFRAIAGDDQQDPNSLTVSWSSDLDGVINEDPADADGNLLFATGALSGGTHVITVTVADEDLKENKDTVQITVGDDGVVDGDTPPTLTIEEPGLDDFGREGEPVSFIVTVQDAQDAPTDLEVELISDLSEDGAPFCAGPGDDAGAFACDALLDVGLHIITFAVEDLDGNRTERTRELEVFTPDQLDDDDDGFSEDEGDCDDANDAIFPGATELPNGVDDDCNGVIDDGTVNFDDDLDGFTEVAGDCDDSVSSTYPGAPELCDGVDNDCDVFVDEGTNCVDDDLDGYTEEEGDCDDSSTVISPGAVEVGDAVDNDCDGTIDEGTGLYDDDGDCACETAPCSGSVEPSCATLIGGDCNDTVAAISPSATEVCDLADNDCDGSVDEASAAGAPTWYRDADVDSFGNPTLSLVSCSAPAGYVSNADDCNDSQRLINPAATEVCDAVDNDCDTGVDEGVTSSFWRDADTDGYGNAALSVAACAAPSGYVANSTDCDDTRSGTNPGANELCNGRDDDCDGTTDEAAAVDAPTWYRDADIDGYGTTSLTTRACAAPSGYVGSSTDCNDSVATINPGASERCDLVDNDCDGAVDESAAVDAGLWYRDVDGDGFGVSSSSTRACTAPSGYVSLSTDCNDGNASISPAGTEVCDSLDNDCDLVTDEGVTTTYYRDADSDTYGSPTVTTNACTRPTGYVTNNTDCDDTSSTINPTTRWYRDADGDTYGLSSTFLTQCTRPTGYVLSATDCNDSAATAYPGANEYCSDSIDNDCDGSVNEAGATDCTTYYYDYDNDGYGTSTSQCLCAAGGTGGYYRATSDGDCYDTNSAARPLTTSYYTVNRGDGSYDYNCDGSQTKRYPNTFACSGDVFGCSVTRAGYTGSVPACGAAGSYSERCWGGIGLCTDYAAFSQAQSCR
ncbi:MAG: putative metal-binding motif-containing protein [Deltaproteobacteria bacterium]|nr:putative metal-binding motif-containing protein [Deltaproteobacteria bacterium]